jgi:hypothetical protein
MSVYSRLVIAYAVSGKDKDTDSSKTTKTATLSQYTAMMSNNNISLPNTPSANEVDKNEKVAITEFYTDSYYMALRNKTSYYPADNFCTEEI